MLACLSALASALAYEILVQGQSLVSGISFEPVDGLV